MPDTDNTTPAAPAQAPPRAELQARYDALAARCGGFDRETQLLLREHDDARKRLAEDRKKLRAALLNEKLAATKALAAAPAPDPGPAASVEAVADLRAAIRPGDVITAHDESDGSDGVDLRVEDVRGDCVIVAEEVGREPEATKAKKKAKK